jgi:hypothetical protein
VSCALLSCGVRRTLLQKLGHRPVTNGDQRKSPAEIPSGRRCDESCDEPQITETDSSEQATDHRPPFTFTIRRSPPAVHVHSPPTTARRSPFTFPLTSYSFGRVAPAPNGGFATQMTTIIATISQPAAQK